MKLSDFSREILFGGSLESKLLDFEVDEFDIHEGKEQPENPEREKKLAFSKDQEKFPKKNSLKVDSNRGKALHFFANHELLAIEMMAAALYCYPTQTEEDIKFKKGILSALRDEQKHFKLYLKQMNNLGVNFGDFSLNDFFWRQMKFLRGPESFFALMSLTFEMANLDFCLYYKDIFEEIEDHKTAQIMQVVLEDEVSHVSLGRYWLERWAPDKKLWDYYKSLLPEFITPARAKGILFSREVREKAGLPSDFIESLENYNDNFAVTKRKQWDPK